MSISSVSSNLTHTAPVQSQQPTNSAKQVANDKNTVTAQAAPRPTVNTSGQVVGTKINTQA
jgi:hypothetical protein